MASVNETFFVSKLEAQRRRFIGVQAGKAALGAVLSVIFVAFVGKPGLTEAIAIGGLFFPALLAIVGFTRMPLAALETVGFAAFAALVGYLAALTGGLLSPVIVWLVLIPAEAALVGERPAVARAAVATAGTLIALSYLHLTGMLPTPRLMVSLPQVYAVSILAAVVQAALIAIATQDRQRAADSAAAQGAAMYRFLADNAMDLITRHSPDGRIRFASPAAHMLLGVEPDALIGKAPARLVHPADLKIIQSAFVEASYFGRPATAEIRMKRPDQTYVWMEMRCRPASEVDGTGPSAIVAVTRDISERKRHERALIEARDAAEAASRAKSKFLANMSHELRTPLNAIIGFSEVMSHEMFGPLGNPRYVEYSGLVHESGGHLLELINSILDMSKIEAGKFELTEEVFDLTDVASGAQRFVKMAAERAGVALRFNIAPGAKQIFADKRAVKQVLINLLTNGIKFTPRGGIVAVDVMRNAAGIEISVTDNGVGISANDLQRLGRPFEQVEGEHHRTKEGTGLGLALVKAFAAMHGGEIDVTSALGEGTCVRVRLPYGAVDEEGMRVDPVEELRGAA
ncbi:MAG TPA: PAS domain-containing sensor histidine kinase [Rhizomicrobium sp.]|jgi:cell cycle sensor histidine kinase DivJ|nr:PAS domain-containing sensor histidine kinase [Rhizomicrobium sp.]